MTNGTPPPPDESPSSITRDVLAILKDEPAYALIFGVYALFSLVGATTLGYGLLASSQSALLVGMFTFVIAMAAALWTVKMIEEHKTRRMSPVPVAREIVDRVDPDTDSFLADVGEHLNRALEDGHPLLRREIVEQCHFFRARSADWAQGHLITSGEAQYNRLLIALYEDAAENVFATSAPEYLDTWASAFGQRIKESHQRSRARVQRVFVFNNRGEVTQKVLAELEDQARIENVEVRLYFDDEDRTFVFTPDIARDFTVIDDGQAVGVTRSFAQGGLEAKWFFRDPVRSEPFIQVMGALLHGSISLDRFGQQQQKARPAI